MCSLSFYTSLVPSPHLYDLPHHNNEQNYQHHTQQYGAAGHDHTLHGKPGVISRIPGAFLLTVLILIPDLLFRIAIQSLNIISSQRHRCAS